jgi:hypothetical protein
MHEKIFCKVIEWSFGYKWKNMIRNGGCYNHRLH